MSDRPSISEKVVYAGGDFASCLFWQTFSLFLLIFYTDTYGLAPAVVGTMLLVSRFWDAINDPLMGMIADRTRSRHGRFRPWIRWGILPLIAAGVLTFVTPDLGETGKIVYAYVTYTLVMMAYTMVNVPYGALLGVMSPASEDRTQLATLRFVGAFLGNIVVQGSLLWLVAHLGGGNDRVGYPLAMALYGVVAGGLFYAVFHFSRERVHGEEHEPTPVGRDFRLLLTNRPWVVLCLVGLGTLIYISIRGGATLYYFKYYQHDEAGVANFLVVGTVFAVLGALLTPKLTQWCGGKKRTLIVLSAVSAVLMAGFYFAGPGDRALIYGLNIALNIPGAALFPLIWSMYADTADYGEWRYERRATGLVFSAATFSQKMGWAFGGSIAAYLLQFVGFVANAEQTPTALAGIRQMMSFLPAGVAVGVTVLACFYGIDESTESLMQAELQARRAAGPDRG